MTQRKPKDQTWESFAEEQIREAQESGEFDNLPGFGQPMPPDYDVQDEDWWLKRKLKRERLNVLPPALAIRLDVEQTLESLASISDERRVRQTIEALNERIRTAHFAAVWGPPNTTMPLDPDEIVNRWRNDQGAGSGG